MDKMEFILATFAKEPIIYTCCLLSILITTVVLLIFLLRQIENPLKLIFSYLGKYITQLCKEISGKAGYAGVMDLVIVVFMFILAFSVLNSSSVASALGVPDGKSPVYSIIIILASAFVFIVSLKMSLEHEKFEKLSKL